PAEEIGTGYFQETHPQELFRECSVYVEQVSDIGQLPRLLSIAMRAAVEQRGVAVLVISASMFVTELPEAKPEIIKATNSRILPATEELDRAAELLNSCKKVTILDRKSTRLNSSHVSISYAVFCLKKKTTDTI